MTPDEYEEMMTAVVAQLGAEFRMHVEAMSVTAGTPRGDISRALLERLTKQIRLVNGGGSITQADKRLEPYRCRFRIYQISDGYQEPLGDSDPDLPADRPGTAVIRGLQFVGEEAANAASAFHLGAPLRGLDSDTIRRKIPGVRPTLSRRGGNATWRLYYDTPESFTGADGHLGGYMIRIDLENVKS